MDLIDDILPDLDGAEMLVEKGQIDRLDMRISTRTITTGLRRTEYASAPHGWLMNGDPAM